MLVSEVKRRVEGGRLEVEDAYFVESTALLRVTRGPPNPARGRVAASSLIYEEISLLDFQFNINSIQYSGWMTARRKRPLPIARPQAGAH